jgi:hypothetical protein
MMVDKSVGNNQRYNWKWSHWWWKNLEQQELLGRELSRQHGGSRGSEKGTVDGLGWGGGSGVSEDSLGKGKPELKQIVVGKRNMGMAGKECWE